MTSVGAPGRTMAHGRPGDRISREVLGAAARVGAYAERRMALAVAAFEADAAFAADAAYAADTAAAAKAAEAAPGIPK